MQIGRDEAFSADDGHTRILQGLDKGRDDVAVGQPTCLQHDHDRPVAAAQAGLQGVAGRERFDGAHDLVGEAGRRGRLGGDDDDLSVLRPPRGQRLKGAARVGHIGQQDDAGVQAGRLIESRGHRCHRPVDGLALGHDVGWSRREEVVGRAHVDDAPAGLLDAGLELVGTSPVALGSGVGALIGERHDLFAY